MSETNIQKKKQRIWGTCFVFGIVILLVGSSGISWFSGFSLLDRILHPSTQGTLEVHIKDHREAIDDFAQLHVNVKSIRISPKGKLKSPQAGWKELLPSVSKLDLTQLTGGKNIRIFRAELQSGFFQALHLKLVKIEGILKKDHRQVLIKNRITPMRIPFSIRSRSETSIVLDLVVMDIGDHLPRGYELHMRGYELYRDGRLVDRIPPR